MKAQEDLEQKFGFEVSAGQTGKMQDGTKNPAKQVVNKL